MAAEARQHGFEAASGNHSGTYHLYLRTLPPFAGHFGRGGQALRRLRQCLGLPCRLTNGPWPQPRLGLVRDALTAIPAGVPVLAAVAPGNAASVPALLSAEFIPWAQSSCSVSRWRR